VELKICRTASEEAKPNDLKSSTEVLFQKKPVPLDIATDSKKMDAFPSEGLR
jgi:hypothetical protein